MYYVRREWITVRTTSCIAISSQHISCTDQDHQHSGCMHEQVMHVYMLLKLNRHRNCTCVWSYLSSLYDAIRTIFSVRFSPDTTHQTIHALEKITAHHLITRCTHIVCVVVFDLPYRAHLMAWSMSVHRISHFLLYNMAGFSCFSTSFDKRFSPLIIRMKS